MGRAMLAAAGAPPIVRGHVVAMETETGASGRVTAVKVRQRLGGQAEPWLVDGET